MADLPLQAGPQSAFSPEQLAPLFGLFSYFRFDHRGHRLIDMYCKLRRQEALSGQQQLLAEAYSTGAADFCTTPAFAASQSVAEKETGLRIRIADALI